MRADPWRVLSLLVKLLITGGHCYLYLEMDDWIYLSCTVGLTLTPSRSYSNMLPDEAYIRENVAAKRVVLIGDAGVNYGESFSLYFLFSACVHTHTLKYTYGVKRGEKSQT
jgi:hypothetical protein